MKDKLELQKQYIEVKNKLEELQDKYFDSADSDYKDIQELEREIKYTYTLLKSLNKQIYYER